MEKDKDCKVSACCTTHRCEILGVIFLAVATVLTLLTYSGIGIFGMFLVGLVFCCHKHLGCRRCNCGCCSPDTSTCAAPAPALAPKNKTVVAAKKTTSKK